MAAEEPTRQPVRDAPVSQNGERPPLDWGDEEPDPVWERLYYKGLVIPPFPSPEHDREIVEQVMRWGPLGKPMTDEDLMCALGRCSCCE